MRFGKKYSNHLTACWLGELNNPEECYFTKHQIVERVFSRLKEHRRLNNITVRGKRKVTIHCYLSLMVVQAHAMHSYVSNQAMSIS